MRYLLEFSYDGSNFYGYQTQKGLRTVQEELEKAAYKINNNTKTSVTSSGRTDRGVHALCQIAHVDIDVSITPYKLKRAFNTFLDDDIHIINVKEVPSDFHARYFTTSKTYQYHLNMTEYNPLRRNYCYQHNYQLDVEAMRDAIKYFIGEHDFRSFVTECSKDDNCVRTITEADISYDPYYDGELVFTFKGNGFKRYQVRNMVGALIKVGTSKIKSEEIKNILESKTRGKNGVTARSEGLYLVNVEYSLDKAKKIV